MQVNMTFEQVGNVLKVRVQGNQIGYIETVEGGYQYTALDSGMVGPVFVTLELCKESVSVWPDAPTEQAAQKKPYHVKTIKLTYRGMAQTFDEELEDHLNSEAGDGYHIERMQEFRRCESAGMLDDLIAVVITKLAQYE